MGNNESLQGVFWEDRLFEGLFDWLFHIYKKLWIAVAILWTASIVTVYLHDGWKMTLFVVFLQVLIAFPLAALGHATNKYALGKGYFGRAVRIVSYLYGVIGYGSIVGFPIIPIITVL